MCYTHHDMLPCWFCVGVTCGCHISRPAALAGLKARVLRGQPHLPNAKPSPALSTMLHPEYKRLIKEYPFQPVRNQNGDFVNVILVRSPFRSSHQWDLFKQYKDSLLFIGISSFEDFPLPPPNPFSSKFPVDTYVGLFPGFLHMEREPEKVFPPDVKLLLMSQSDFALPLKGPNMPKKYDFTFSGSDQDVYRDCVGWSSFAKNWTFAKEALEAMCSQGVTGVLVATKDKRGRKACTIPPNCEGKIVQTTFLAQEEFFSYVRQSKFLFVPQVHDASPRVTTQAGCLLDVDWLWNIRLTFQGRRRTKPTPMMPFIKTNKWLSIVYPLLQNISLQFDCHLVSCSDGVAGPCAGCTVADEPQYHWRLEVCEWENRRILSWVLSMKNRRQAWCPLMWGCMETPHTLARCCSSPILSSQPAPLVLGHVRLPREFGKDLEQSRQQPGSI